MPSDPDRGPTADACAHCGGPAPHPVTGLVRAAELCGLAVTAIPQKQLAQHAVNLLATPLDGLTQKVAMLGKSVGPPWGSDQKNAALAALIVLEGRGRDAAL